MTGQTDYTEHEWELLKGLPFIAASGVIAASKSRAIGKVKEAFAIAPGTLEAARQFPDNQLIQELLSKSKEEAKGEHQHEKSHVDDRVQVAEYVLAQCREAVAILESKSSAEEAAEYKRWVVASAEHVARASKSGGFLGLGGKLIDEQEAQFLQTLQETLG